MDVLSYLLCVVILSSASSYSPTAVPDEEKNSNHWKRLGQKTLEESIKLISNNNVAKNVIFFLGDGMGITTVTSMRIYKGQKMNKNGEDELLAFDQFPHVSLSKTYGVDKQLSDSANTATAFLCGVKTNYGTLGVDGRVTRGDCESSLDPSTHVTSILKWAQDAGKSTGFVTSTRVTHATPAALYCHSADRDWESSTGDSRCKDIAQQLVFDSPGKDMRVILGGGTREFIPDTVLDIDGINGSRIDSVNLLTAWEEDKKRRNLRGQSVFTAEDFRKVDPSSTDYLLGLFNSDHLPYVADRSNLTKEYPTLVEFTQKAIEILQKNDKGFFLLVEGGKIDIAHHMNLAMKALEEGVEFDKSVEAAVQMTNEDDTLIVVTADHSHTLSVGGNYPKRGTNIIGVGGVSGTDNRTFTTLGYSNGPGYKKDARDFNLTDAETVDKEYKVAATVPLGSETHGAEDVGVYARGPMSHLFHGVHEQSYIPYVMGYASCVGPNQNHCASAGSSVSSFQFSSLQFMLFGAIAYYFSFRLLLS